MRKPALPEKFFDHDGLRIRYVDDGAGEAVVFLHGLGGSITDNDACFPYLTDKFRVIAFDAPGTGGSDKPDRDYDMDSLVDFALDFLTRLGLEKFYLAGGSMGGMYALLTCLRAPERVRKAVVYSASGVWPPRPLAARLLRALPPETVKPFMRFTSLFWHSPLYPGFLEARREAIAYIESHDMPGFGRHVLGCAASQLDRDYRKIYAEVKTPVLILWGTHDFAMPVSMGRRLNKILPGSRLVVAPGAGHNISTERPEWFAEKAAEFFEKHK